MMKDGVTKDSVTNTLETKVGVTKDIVTKSWRDENVQGKM